MNTVPPAEAAVPLGSTDDYTIVPRTPPTAYGDPNTNRTTLKIYRDTGSNWRYAISVDKSEYGSDGHPRAAYLSIFNASGAFVQTVRLPLDAPFGSVATESTVPNNGRQMKIAYKVPGYYAGQAVVALTSPWNANLEWLYSYNSASFGRATVNQAHSLPRMTAQPTRYLERGTNNPVRPDFVQWGLNNEGYTTVPVDVPGWTLAEDLLPANQNGDLAAEFSMPGKAGETYYRYRNTTAGSFWLKFVFTADGVADVSGYYLRRGGSNAVGSGTNDPLPANVPPVDYDFDSNPSGLPIVRDRLLTPDEAKDIYSPLRFPTPEQTAAEQGANDCRGIAAFKQFVPFTDIESFVLRDWTPETRIRSRASSAAFTGTCPIERDPGTTQYHTFGLSTEQPVIYYYDRQKFSVEKQRPISLPLFLRRI